MPAKWLARNHRDFGGRDNTDAAKVCLARWRGGGVVFGGRFGFRRRRGLDCGILGRGFRLRVSRLRNRFGHKRAGTFAGGRVGLNFGLGGFFSQFCGFAGGFCRG